MNKGGRPKSENKRSQQLAVMCTMDERKLISEKAKASNISVSRYLRELAIKGQVGSRKKEIPKEVLLFTATLNHLAANMNQLAKKRNQYEQLTDQELATLQNLSLDIKNLAAGIKKFIQ